MYTDVIPIQIKRNQLNTVNKTFFLKRKKRNVKANIKRTNTIVKLKLNSQILK